MSPALSADESRIVGECLRAAAAGPFFEDAEFETVLGVTRQEMAAVARSWPSVDWNEELVRACVNGALVNLVDYPHDIRGPEWRRYISAGEEEVYQLLLKFMTRV